VADWLEVEAHVLRFWESKFSQIKPVKRAGGRRYYRPSDMRLIGGIKTLLHDQGLTIRGVQKIIREDGMPHVASLSPPLDDEMEGAGTDDQVIDATALPAPADSSAPTGGFIDIDALAGEDAPPPQEQEPAASNPETDPDIQPATELEEAAETAAAAPTPEPVAAYSPPKPEAPDPPEPAAIADTGETYTPPTPLSELRALLHGAVPFTLSQRQQLAPMVARLEALATRLGGHGPSA